MEHILYARRMSLNCLETVKKRWGSMDLEDKVRVKFIHHLNVLVESYLRWMNLRLSNLGYQLLSSIHLITYKYSSLTEFLSSSFHILYHHHLLYPQPSSFSSTSRYHLQRFVTRAVVDCPLIFHFKPAAPTDEEWDQLSWTQTESQFIPFKERQSEILDYIIEIKDDYSIS